MNVHANAGSPPESFANPSGALPNDSPWNREEGTGNRGGEEGREQGREQGDRNREADPFDALIERVRTIVTFQCSQTGDDEITPTVEELATTHGCDQLERWLSERPSHCRYRYARDLATAITRDLTEPTAVDVRPQPPRWSPPPGLTEHERVEAERAFAELVAAHGRNRTVTA